MGRLLTRTYSKKTLMPSSGNFKWVLLLPNEILILQICKVCIKIVRKQTFHILKPHRPLLKIRVTPQIIMLKFKHVKVAKHSKTCPSLTSTGKVGKSLHIR